MGTNVIHVAPIVPVHPVNESKKFRMLVTLGVMFLILIIAVVLLLHSRGCLTGPCSEGVEKFLLSCPAGYSGTKCKININECASSPCRNGGNCTDGVNGYTCKCAAGYTGIHCDANIDECASSPCQNGGNCTDGVNKYSCACALGYRGINCDVNINECASSPCQNGGNCTDGVNGYTCTCPAGYSGVNCETNIINECASSPCGANSIKCTDLLNAYNCTCKAGFAGKHCEMDLGCSGKGWFTEDTGNITRPLNIEKECSTNPDYMPGTFIDCKYEIIMGTTKNISFVFPRWRFLYGRDDDCTGAFQYVDFFVNEETTATKRYMIHICWLAA